MNRFRIFAALSGVALSAFSIAQFPNPMPPDAHNGRSYWFGAGPRQTFLSSSTQGSGAFLEAFKTQGIDDWSSSFGGPAISSVSNTPTIRGFFDVFTELSIQPYVYVDGYFGVQASLSGMSSGGGGGAGGRISLGSSRFFVLHNCPVSLHFSDFSNFVSTGDLDGDGQLDVVLAFFDVFVSAYGKPGNPVFASSSLEGGSSSFFDVFLDLSITGGGAMCDVERSCIRESPTRASTGLYRSTGSCTVSSS